MIKNLILVCCMIATLAACRTKDQADKQQIDGTNDSTMTAIIPWDFDYPFDSLGYSPTTLSHVEIKQIETLLVTTVTEYNTSLSSGKEDYKIDLTKKYKKQLIAVVNSKGQKEVWVNCLCHIRDDSWRVGIAMVSDGGPCFFNFKINLTTNQVSELLVNGFA